MKYLPVVILGFIVATASELLLAKMPDNISDEELALLPHYCPDTWGFKGHAANKPKWIAVMGNDFSHMHHYCWARINFARAERAGKSHKERQALLLSSIIDFQYVANAASDDFILMPEVLTWLGRAQILRGQASNAEKTFAKARALKPDYWPSYSHWAEYLLANDRKDEALTVVKSGLQHAPTEKVLHELFRVLGGKPQDIPPPNTQ